MPSPTPSKSTTKNTPPTTTTTTTSPPPLSAPSATQPQTATSTSPAQPTPQTLEARHTLLTTLSTLSHPPTQHLHALAGDIHANSAQLTAQSTRVAGATRALGKEREKQAKAAAEAAGKLKELGDIQNWAEVLEREILVLEDAVRRGEEKGSGVGKGEGNGEGNGEGKGERERAKVGGGWR